MNTQPIYANEIHKVVIEDYLTLLTTFTEELATDSQYSLYLETIDTIIDYHNHYDGELESWIMILPLHLSVMTSGLFIGIETDDNRAAIRGYKLILDNHLHALAEKLSDIINTTNE